MRSDDVHQWPPSDAGWDEAVSAADAVLAAVDGSGPAVCPDVTALPDCEIPDDTALLISTSGSTGTPKFAALSARALTSSVTGVHGALGGPGQWMLSVPPSHISGFQGLLRSLTAGFAPVPLAQGPFTPESFMEGASRLDDSAPRRYTTLVPTQLVRLLEDPAAIEVARSFDVLLIGGAPLSRATAARARAAGLTLSTGYGASEVAGGVLYDGRPLTCAEVVVDADADGRICIAGDVVASGYAGRPDLDAIAFPVRDGRRWYRTDDLGRIEQDGTVTVLGRADDIINTGGLKVAPRIVEEAITDAWSQVADVVVVGVPDCEWGESVTALVVLRADLDAPLPDLVDLRAGLDLPHHARPRAVLVVDALPRKGPGKVDRGASRVRAAATLRERA